MKKYFTIFIENNSLKIIEHDNLGPCSRFWIDTEFPKKGFTNGKFDEKTEDYDEALSKITGGSILELELINSLNSTEI